MSTFSFLSNKGLTKTEANHFANVTGEIAAKSVRDIEQVSPLKKELHKGGGKFPLTKTSKGVDLFKLCQEEGRLHALTAWLREGIKEFEERFTELKRRNWMSFVTDQLPDEVMRPVFEDEIDESLLPDMTPEPIEVDELTEKDIIGTLSVKERADYLTQEAMAAHIGKKIHNSGAVTRMRSDLASYEPTYFKQVGDESYVVTVEVNPEYSAEKVEKLYFDLQKEHREAEKRVNYYKAKVKNVMNKKNVEIQRKNAKALEEWNATMREYEVQKMKLLQELNERNKTRREEYDQAIRERNTILKKLQKSAEAVRKEEINKLAKLKVIVPSDLQSLLDEVKTYAKK